MSKKIVESSNEVKAIVEFLKANKGKTMTWDTICKGAGVETKTGYLAGVKKVLGADNFGSNGETTIETKATRKVKTYAYGDTADSDKQ